MGLFTSRGGVAVENNRRITSSDIRNYLLNRPEVLQTPTGDLRIGKDGQGKIEIVNAGGAEPPRVVIYADSPAGGPELFENVNRAFDWCLGPDNYSSYRLIFDVDSEMLTTVPQSVKDLDRLCILALAYFEVIGDPQCLSLERRLQALTRDLRATVLPHLGELL